MTNVLGTPPAGEATAARTATASPSAVGFQPSNVAPIAPDDPSAQHVGSALITFVGAGSGAAATSGVQLAQAMHWWLLPAYTGRALVSLQISLAAPQLAWVPENALRSVGLDDISALGDTIALATSGVSNNFQKPGPQGTGGVGGATFFRRGFIPSSNASGGADYWPDRSVVEAEIFIPARRVTLWLWDILCNNAQPLFLTGGVWAIGS